jgi:hypothetical protein
MSQEQKYILIAFGVLTFCWVVSGLLWVALQMGMPSRPSSMAELKKKAANSPHWYLIPFSDRTTRIWKYLSWLTGGAWLLAGLLERTNS